MDCDVWCCCVEPKESAPDQPETRSSNERLERERRRKSALEIFAGKGSEVARGHICRGDDERMLQQLRDGPPL